MAQDINSESVSKAQERKIILDEVAIIQQELDKHLRPGFVDYVRKDELLKELVTLYERYTALWCDK